MTGQGFINSFMQDVGRIQVLTTDTNLRSLALDWLNRVIRYISGRSEHWTWLEKSATFSTVANQMTYDYPSDIDLSGRKVFTIRQKDSPAKLIFINQRYLDELVPEPDTVTGNPLYYTMFASGIRLYPIPDAVYTMYIRYIKLITAFSDSAASTSDIPAKWDDVVLDGMKMHGFRVFPEWGDANSQKNIFEAGIQTMIRDNDIELDNDYQSDSHSIPSPRLTEMYPWRRQGGTT
jgi:hypothetical protein